MAAALSLLVLVSAVQPAQRVRAGDGRTRVVEVARRHVGSWFAGDCSAFVRRVYAEAGVPLRQIAASGSGSEALHRSLHHVRRARPGDLVFFHRTHDREQPGPRRNRFTHVGVVEAVDGPQVSVIHRSGTGVRRLAMNLARPGDPDQNGPLRRRRPGDPPGVRYLSGQLFAGYASAWRAPEMRARRAHR